MPGCSKQFSIYIHSLLAAIILFLSMSPQLHASEGIEPVRDEYVLLLPRINPGGLSEADMASIIEDMADVISEKTGIRLRVEYEDSSNLFYRLKDYSADFAFINGKDYGFYWKGALPVKPLVTYTIDGKKTHRVCLYVSGASGIDDITGLRGGIIDIPNLISEYVYALRGFMEEGGIEQPAPDFFRDFKTVKNPRSVSLGLLVGDIDGAMLRTDQMKYVLQGDSRFDDIRPIQCTMELPNGLIVYRRGINPEVVTKIGGILLKAHNDPAFNKFRFIFMALGSRLVRAVEEDYEPYYDFYRRGHSVEWSTETWLLRKKEIEIAVDNTNIDLYLDIAAIHLDNGDYGQATLMLNRALRLDPGNRIARSMLEAAENSSSERARLTPEYENSSAACPAGMVQILAGEFTMGNDNGGFDERPERTVSTGSYCIDVYEYPNVMGVPPVGRKEFEEAVSSCESIGKRLCTEAEWEKACRGPGGNVFPYGDEYKAGVCPAGLDRQNTFEVSGKFAECVSGYGVRDMSGGVREWVADEYAPYPGAERVPAMKGTGKVRRGGPGYKAGGSVSCTYRESSKPDFSASGFRCCKDARTAK